MTPRQLRQLARDQNIADLYQQGNTLEQTGDILGISPSVVLMALVRLNIPRRTAWSGYRLNHQFVREAYLRGESIEGLAKKLGVSTWPIVASLKSTNTPRRTRGSGKSRSSPYYEPVQRLVLQEGYAPANAAKILGISGTRVYQILRKLKQEAAE